MKKIYALMATALMSISLFAQDAPTVAEIADYVNPADNVVLCVKFVGEAEVCNPIHFVGPVSWDLADEHPLFRAVPNHEGWYFASAPYAGSTVYGKPIQEKSDGSLTWDFQPGLPDAWSIVAVEGGKTATLNEEYSTQTSAGYPEAGVYFYEISYWQNHRTPCTVAVKHDYTIYLYAPECEDADYVPAVIGDFNGWAEGVQMNADFDGEGEIVFVATFNDEEGHAFKFRQAGISDWSNQIQVYDEDNDELKENPNITLGAETTITLDYRSGKWSACGQAPQEPCDETPHLVVIGVKVPVDAPAAGVEIIGTFDEWAGTAMSLNPETGWYLVKLQDVTECDEFKFREASTWDNEIVHWVATEWKTLDNIKFRDVAGWGVDDTYKGDPCYMLEMDLSEDYIWKANIHEGIENIVLTEKAHKVVVDGNLYIIRDNKMFNVHGAQVR